MNQDKMSKLFVNNTSQIILNMNIIFGYQNLITIKSRI